MRALIVTRDGSMRAVEIQEPPPFSIDFVREVVLPRNIMAPWSLFERPAHPQKRRVRAVLLPIQDEPRSVAVYEEDGTPAEMEQW